jgi:hypothetical protein
VNGADEERAVSHGRRDTLGRTSADVADREHAAARLMTIRIDLNGEDA